MAISPFWQHFIFLLRSWVNMHINFHSFLSFFFRLDFLFTFQIFSPSESPYPISPSPFSMRLLTYPPTHILLHWHCRGSREHWTPSELRASPTTDVQQGHPLAICGQCHGSLHVYSLVGAPVPGSSRGLACWHLCSLHGAVINLLEMWTARAGSNCQQGGTWFQERHYSNIGTS